MIIRPIEQQDLNEIFSWFHGRKWPLPLVEGIAPKDGLVVVSEAGVMMSCVWYYVTGTALAILEFPGNNPKIDKREAMQSMNILLEHVKKMCEFSEPKIRAVAIYTQNKKLSDYFHSRLFKKQNGFYRCLWIMK